MLVWHNNCECFRVRVDGCMCGTAADTLCCTDHRDIWQCEECSNRELSSSEEEGSAKRARVDAKK